MAKRAASTSSYLGPHEGFRGEVTRATVKYLKSCKGQCLCGETVLVKDIPEHAIDCADAREEAIEVYGL